MSKAAEAVYIFRTNSFLKADDLEKLRENIKRQIEDGLVLTDPHVDYVGREIAIDGCRITVELIKERLEPYTLDELEKHRSGEKGLCAVVIVADLKNPEKQEVSAVLDWDFRQCELVAVWGYGVEPYRARDYMKTWVAYPHKSFEMEGHK